MIRFVNTSLLVIITMLGLSGVVMLYGTWLPWIFPLHKIAGFSLLALLPWKSIIVYRSLARGLSRTFKRSVVIIASLLLALLVLLVIYLAFVWLWQIGPFSVLSQAIIAWHWIFGLALLPFFLFHVWQRWPRPRPSDLLSRRDLLKLFALAGAGLVGSVLTDSIGTGKAVPGQAQRFTGSLLFGSYSGNDFPITGEAIPEIDIIQWRLNVSGGTTPPFTLTYPELLQRKYQKKPEILDCTSGWYCLQDWQGVLLVDLLEEAGIKDNAAGVRLLSYTGYHHTYPIEEARQILLATHVDGDVLADRHGFPLRAVVPGRRGWFWVKWLVAVDILNNPVEVAAGILESPREVLRQWE